MSATEWLSARLHAMKHIFMLAWPIFLTSELLAILYFVNLLWIGHRYDSEELAGASLSCTLINVVGQALIVGMTSALDTLCSQAYGAQSYEMVGIFLQRMLVIVHLLLVLIVIAFLNASQILIWLHQLPNVAVNAGIFSRYFIIALWPLSMWYCLRRYLQSQGRVKIILPSVCCAILGQLAGLYVFDVYLGLGFAASAMALGCAYWLQLICLVCAIRCTGVYKQTWPRFPCAWNCHLLWKDWQEILSLALPSICMLCTEWWAFEIQAIFAGLIDAESLAGFALTLNCLTMLIKIPLSISWANGIVVAHKLGKRRPHEASAAWDASVILSTIMTGGVSLVCWFGKHLISQLYVPQASHARIRETMENGLQILAVYLMIDQIQRCGQGAIRGLGMQKIGALTNVFSYYCIGIPIGLYLCFERHWHVSGLWIGMCVGCTVSSIAFIVMRVRIDWKEQAERAYHRIQNREDKLHTLIN